MSRRNKTALSPLESRVMRIVWDRDSATAEEVREELAPEQALKDSTVRTVLRRLEAKGYVRHTFQGRVYVYTPAVPPGRVAADAVRTIVERFFNGSVENLLVGMVDDRLLSAATLKQLAQKIAEAESRERGKTRPKH